MIKKKCGFTLAEVLVTLMIIGVIASMTIPGLKRSSEMRENVAGCKKAYSVLSQATSLASMEQGSFKRWNFKDGNQASIETAYSYYKPYLNITRECINSIGCWVQSKNLINQNQYSDLGFGINVVTFSTADGMNITMDGIAGTEYGVNLTGHSIAFIADVNGDKKPNTLGIDIFAFVLTSDRDLVPAGTDNSSAFCIAGGSGFDCAAKVIKEGKIDY